MRLADLIAGVINDEQWSDFTRKVFGTSVEDFERGCNAHLDELLGE